MTIAQTKDNPLTPIGTSVHPVMPIPFEILVQNRRFQGRGLSLVNGKAVGLLEPDLDGRQDLVLLQFNFEGFAVTLEADVSLRIVETSGENWLEFTFLDPTGPHLPQLRHILNAFIAGDLINLGLVLQPTADARNTPKKAAKSRAFSRIVGRAARGLVTLCFTFGLVWLAYTLVETRILTVTEARPAIVAMPGETLRAPSAGQIELLNPDAAEGEVAFTILSNAGIMLSLKMPCACEIAEVATFEGATVLAGEPVLRLADTTGTPIVTAQLSEASLAAIVDGYDIELRTADGLVMPATLGENAAREITAQGGDGPVTVTLTTATPLPVEATGTLMSVQLRRPSLIPGMNVAVLKDRISALVADAANYALTKVQG